ncbi:hypothetical protein THAOC_35150, partial [Thalassiosira oceanica]
RRGRGGRESMDGQNDEQANEDAARRIQAEMWAADRAAAAAGDDAGGGENNGGGNERERERRRGRGRKQRGHRGGGQGEGPGGRGRGHRRGGQGRERDTDHEEPPVSDCALLRVRRGPDGPLPGQPHAPPGNHRLHRPRQEPEAGAGLPAVRQVRQRQRPQEEGRALHGGPAEADRRGVPPLPAPRGGQHGRGLGHDEERPDHGAEGEVEGAPRPDRHGKAAARVGQEVLQGPEAAPSQPQPGGARVRRRPRLPGEADGRTGTLPERAGHDRAGQQRPDREEVQVARAEDRRREGRAQEEGGDDELKQPEDGSGLNPQPDDDEGVVEQVDLPIAREPEAGEEGSPYAAKVEDDEDMDDDNDDEEVKVASSASDVPKKPAAPAPAGGGGSGTAPNAVRVPLDHSPQAVKLLLEYCYTNRVQSLGHEAFVKSSRFLNSRDVGTAAAKQSGPVSPFRKHEWPEGGHPTVSLHLALAGIALAEEAHLPRLSLMCEVAASQLVNVKSVVDVLTACSLQQTKTGNRLPMLRKAAMLDCVLGQGPAGVEACYANVHFKKGMEDRRDVVRQLGQEQADNGTDQVAQQRDGRVPDRRGVRPGILPDAHAPQPTEPGDLAQRVPARPAAAQRPEGVEEEELEQRRGEEEEEQAEEEQGVVEKPAPAQTGGRGSGGPLVNDVNHPPDEATEIKLCIE